jgi:hypothetical protein
MSNKLIGYAILIPTVLGFIALFTVGINQPLLSKIDEQVYFAVFFIITICLLIGVIKLWWLPNREKQWIPVKTRVLLFWTILFFVIAGASSELDFGEQLEMLLGLISLIVIFTVSFRLITTPVEIDGVVQKVNFVKELKTFGVITLGVIGLVTLLVLMSSDTVTNEMSQETETQEVLSDLTEEEKIAITSKLLSVYSRLYFVTQDNSDEATTEGEVISTWLLEVMNDRKMIERLMLEVQGIDAKNDKTIETTKLVLSTTLLSLQKSFLDFENYLRTVSEFNIDIAEFRYQGNLHTANNKEAFLVLLEGSALYPYIFIEFAEEEGGENRVVISETGRQEVLSEIERLFGDIFIEHELWNKETGMNNTVVILVQNLKDFFDFANIKE